MSSRVFSLFLLTVFACRSDSKPEGPNVLPELMSVTISPDSDISTSTLLLCRATAEDANDDLLQYDLQWSTGNGDQLGNEVFLQLSPELVRPGDEILCAATVTDGRSEPIVEVARVSIGNALPVIESIEIAPSDNIKADDSLQCTATGYDPDMDSLTWEYAWEIDGVNTTQGDSIQLDPSIVEPGQSVICQATAMDGSSGSVSLTAEVMVENSVPIIGALTLLPSAPHYTDTLSCEATDLFDLNGDSIAISYAWRIDGLDAEVDSSSLEGPFDVGAMIQCMATPNDGVEDGAIVSASVVIGNAKPEISDLLISPSIGVKADSLLTCTPTVTDADGDTIDLTYAWTDGDGNGLGSDPTLQLSPTTVAVGASVQCEVTAFDGAEYATMMAVVTVENTFPVVASDAEISASPSATTGGELTCQAAFTDLNDGSLSVDYTWSNSSGIEIGVGPTYVISYYDSDVHEMIACTATAVDQQGESIQSQVSVLYENTPPTAPVISLTSGSGFVGEDDLVCSILVDSDEIDYQQFPIGYNFTWNNADNSFEASYGPFSLSLHSTVISADSVTTAGDWLCSVSATDGIDSSIEAIASVTLSYSADLLTAGDLIISELMINPDAVSDTEGEWIELYNNTASTINLNGLVLADDQASTTIDQNVFVGPGDYVLLGSNADSATNGGIDLDYEYAAIQLNNSNGQTLSLSNAIGTLDAMTWGDGMSPSISEGRSFSLSINHLDSVENDDGLYWCPASSMMPSADYGTPGMANDDCDEDGDGAYHFADCDDEDALSTTVVDDADCDSILTADDCDDTDASSNSIAMDADCDGALTAEDCDDADPNSTIVATDADCDGFMTIMDCDDSDPNRFPLANEYCNGADDNCDGVVDEATALDTTEFYLDSDGDGYGDAGIQTFACNQPAGYASIANDCDDNVASTNPGADEYCNGADDDCDGDIDESSAVDASTFYYDNDNDGYGDTNNATVSCFQPNGYVTTTGDCDDGAAYIRPGLPEYCNNYDDNCDGWIDDNSALDTTTWYQDGDGDGYGNANATLQECWQPNGYVSMAGDCADGNSTIRPNRDDPCDNVDNDCDGSVDEDGLVNQPGLNTSFCPPENCEALKAMYPSAPTGVYTVDPNFDGSGTTLTCEMDIDGGGWSQMTGAYLSGLSSGANREYLYTVGDVYTASAAWYISPSTTAIWNWNSYQPVNGTYYYATSGHSPTGSFSCINNEQGQSGIGCSNGPGNNSKCFVSASSTYQDPQHGLATICQDQPNVFNMGGACHSPVQVWVR